MPACLDHDTETCWCETEAVFGPGLLRHRICVADEGMQSQCILIIWYAFPCIWLCMNDESDLPYGTAQQMSHALACLACR